ncbi:MAG: hypothetical protein U1E77_06745 [Inhella sp.]
MRACLHIALALLLSANLAQAEEFSGRGVHAFASGSGCPLPTLSLCNRVALDDPHSRVELDRNAGTIRFRNDQHYPDERVIGDVLLHGQAKAADGRVVPVSLHLLLSKEGKRWSHSVHAHSPVPGDLTEIKLDAYRIEAELGGQGQTLLTPEQALRTLASPSTAAKLAQQFVQVRDNRAAPAKASPATPATPPAAADITIALGLGKAALPAVRASLHLPGGPGSLTQALAGGDWKLELQALRSHLPLSVIRRDLFLFGLEQVELLQPLHQAGFAKHDKLLLGARKGQGYLGFRGRQVDFPQAAEAARAFLQDSFIGLVLSGQQRPAP